MKGIVFIEFNQRVEAHFAPEIADRIIMEAAPASAAAYTAVGACEHQQLIDRVASLSRETGIPTNELVKTFGRHLAQRFSAPYPTFFGGVDSLFGGLPKLRRSAQ